LFTRQGKDRLNPAI